MGEKDEVFAGTIIQDTCTVTRGVGGNRGGRWGRLGGWGVGCKGRKLYLSNNKKVLKNTEILIYYYTEFIVLLLTCLP